MWISLSNTVCRAVVNSFFFFNTSDPLFLSRKVIFNSEEKMGGVGSVCVNGTIMSIALGEYSGNKWV